MKKSLGFLSLVLVCSICSATLKGGIIYSFEIFTSNGQYSDSNALDLYVDVTVGTSTVDFEFHNESLVDSSIARIYFDDISLLGDANIVNGPGCSFSMPATPRDLPAWNTLDPPFEKGAGIDFSSDPARPHNGINPGEWLSIIFEPVGGSEPEDITTALANGDLRVGIHIIALSDGSSESAVNIPEPGTIILLSLGTMALLRKRYRQQVNNC